MIRLLVLLIALGCTITFVQSVGAQEPTATDTPIPPEPTRTPRPDEGTLIIHVINDLNSNGSRDVGEPGLEGWVATLTKVCGDALIDLGPSASEGTIVYYLSYPADYCVWINVQFGWFATDNGYQRFHMEPGETVEVTFLVRQVGQRVHRFLGDVIVNGLPAAEGTVLDVLVGRRSCSDGHFTGGGAWAPYTLYALSDDDRVGCARDNQEFSLTVDGTVVAVRAFIPGCEERLDLIIGPPPMQFNTWAPEGATPVPYVGSTVCGEARYDGYGYRVYVLPDALRAGCGAPGRIVTVRAGGAVILATLWQEGIIYDLTVLTPVLPDAGSQPGSSDDGSLALGLAALAVAASALTVLLGWRLRRGQ